MDVAAIMPCRGRPAQTVANVRRLLATAGYNDAAIICVCDDDPEVYEALKVSDVADRCNPVLLGGPLGVGGPIGYWRVLATLRAPYDLLCNLANDLLPGRNWLARGMAAYRARFGDGDGLMGFNDGLHGPEHSSHFLISRALLDRYGGWPTWYSHNFGDTELCRRAQADGCYGKAAWAVLYHDHMENGANDDAIYQEGRASYAQDARLFEERRRTGWR